MTSIPDIQFTSTGLVLPTEADILAGVQADINAAFGGGLNPGLETPQGQIASSLTAIIADKNAQIANLVQQFDPDYATGRFQDAIGKFYFLTRNPATSTTTTVTCVGAVGTFIPTGSSCIDSNGEIYLSTVDATIPATGNIQVIFQAQNTGPLSLSANDLTIYQGITGWDSVTNTTGTPGTYEESRADFEYRRKNSVSRFGVGYDESVLGALFSVSGVTDAYVFDNNTSSVQNIGSTSYAVAGHSIFCSVAGGTDADVAAAIITKKSPGCGTVGSTSVQVQDNVNYSFPYPTWTINFLRPTNTPVYFIVQLQNNALLPSTIEADVKAAIVSAFNGADGGARARIGATIYSARFYSGIAAISQYVNILNLFVGIAPAPSASSVAIGVDQLPTLVDTNISVSLI